MEDFSPFIPPAEKARLMWARPDDTGEAGQAHKEAVDTRNKQRINSLDWRYWHQVAKEISKIARA